MNKLQVIKSITILFLLFKVGVLFSQDKIIQNEDPWFYYDKGYLDNNWMNIKDFSDWKKGKSPLGYGDKSIKTELGFGGNKDKKHITKYFKKKIILDIKYVAFEFKIQRDDGAVIYINGKELFKDNMPNATINSTTLAISTVQQEAESEFNQHYFDNTIFKKGENIISVSIHQAYEDSSDCVFSLELIGHNNPEVLSFVLENKNKTNLDLEREIEKLNSKLEFEKIQLQKESLKSVNFNLKVLLALISILFIISLIGCNFILENLRKKKREIGTKLTDLKVKNLDKEREMITISTNLLHNKQYFKEIKADLKGIKTEDKKTLKSIISQIDYVLDKDEDWGILKEHFNAVHEGFYDKLITNHPSITETELRHCMFIKLHMQTKEIARILLIDPRSVQTARYRIKKKMNLSEDEDLRDYLLKIN